ncbi:protein of unknown function DUF23 domain-containing protein [Aphelenchoides besseyi]|nr:protein of unknown function DUF23 domain-containing protein [Aphelenchoides besseyi]
MSSNFRWKYAAYPVVILFVFLFFGLLTKKLSNRLEESSSIQNVTDEIYVYSGYRVSDDEIRIVLVKNDQSNVQIFYSIGHNQRTESKVLQVECQRSGECPAKFSPSCLLSGYVGTIRDSELIDKEVSVVRLSTDRKEYTLRVRDVRMNSKKKHKLGVCVQPIFVYADWPQLIQFFEYWLDAGATKFYIYRESYSQEVQRIFDFYKANSHAEIELIDWSKLPSRDTWYRKHFDPNSSWYRLEAFLAIFDCMQRARGQVHYVAQSDLDEIFYVNSARSLIDYLQWMEKRNPSMASLNFLSRRVKVPNYWDKIGHLFDFNFGSIREVEFEKLVFRRDYYSKNIYIPERVCCSINECSLEFQVKRFDIHMRRETELIDGTNSSYVHLNVSVHDALVLHFRRVNSSIFLWQESELSSELESWAHRLERNYLRRLDVDRTGVGSGDDERCRKEQYEKKMERCYSLLPCEWAVKSEFMGHLEWYTAPNTWGVI